MDVSEIQNQLCAFLISVTGNEALTSDTDLIEAGVTDSLTMMDLMVFIESEFRLRLDFPDLTPDIFRTPRTIARMVAARLSSRPRALAS